VRRVRGGVRLSLVCAPNAKGSRLCKKNKLRLGLGIAVIGVIAGLAILLPTRNATYAVSETPSTDALTKEEVKLYVHQQAVNLGLSERQIKIADFIINHESTYCWRNGFFEQDIKGDLDRGFSRGCWQISRLYHPEVSDECANSLTCSTQWSLIQIKEGKENMWCSWRYKRLYYPNEHF